MDMGCFSSRLDTARLESMAQPLTDLEHCLQTQWIQPEVCIRIMSLSHLLREAVFHWINAGFRVKEGRSLQEWVLLDYGIGRGDLVNILHDWRVKSPQTYLIVIELPNDSDAILDCLTAGAHSYILQGASGEQIVETMQQVDRGVFQCSREITDRLVERLAKQQEINLPPPVALTQREWDVLQRIKQGQSDREIAAELYIALRTVKYHVHNLLGKLQVQSRWQAAQLAQDNDWLKADRSSRSIQDRSVN
jgi:two-component system, NarL family, response regulator LiaR